MSARSCKAAKGPRSKDAALDVKATWYLSKRQFFRFATVVAFNKHISCSNGDAEAFDAYQIIQCEDVDAVISEFCRGFYEHDVAILDHPGHAPSTGRQHFEVARVGVEFFTDVAFQYVDRLHCFELWNSSRSS